LRRARLRAVGLWALSTVAAGIACLPARADKAADDRAEALYNEGQALMKDGRYADACLKFQASQATAASGGAVLNLGECNDKSGKPADALPYFERAADLARAAGNAKIEAYARSRAEEVRAKVALVTIDAQAVAGEEVSLDGVVVNLPDWAKQSPVSPGDHKLTAHAPNHAPFELVVRFAPGETRALHVPLLAPGVDSASPAPPPAADSHSTQRWVGLSIGVVGIAGVIAGGAVGGLALAKNHESLMYCQTPLLCTQHGIDLTHSAVSLAHASTGLLVAGGVLTGVGVVVFATSFRASPHGERAPGVALVPSVSSEHVSASLMGTF